MSESVPPDDTPTPDAEPPAPPVVAPAKRLHHHLIEWVLLLVVALGLTFGLRAFVFQTYFIPSDSMNPTLQVGDRIVVDKLAIDFGTIHRGDILVFRSPPNEDCSGTRDPVLVKRVIGLPGDSLYSVGNTIYVNGKILKEGWPHFEPLGPPAVAPKAHPIVVAANNYFMLGDNHADSCDSRYWGTITRSDVIGKAFVIVWPLSRIGSL